ncbi:hypothetical protein G7046_g9172 [Stylonectria norvegica]|nr:hypothetical protein G7046_g9172 [Stylonectria norvegica]
MSRTAPARKYGKSAKRSKAERLFAELPQSPIRRKPEPKISDDSLDLLAEKISSIKIEDKPSPRRSPRKAETAVPLAKPKHVDIGIEDEQRQAHHTKYTQEKSLRLEAAKVEADSQAAENDTKTEALEDETETPLRVLTWEDVCPPSDVIIKIAEASYAEVYRVTNDRGTSVIKVIRLSSPIKPQTKAQVRSGLVDEEPHSEEDVQGELQISEWLADIPGFVVYKERYVVQGKTTPQLLETHQAFQKRMKRQDPDRAQFYPSPSRYLDGTRFLVVELGDAGKALEDWELVSESQLWDIFFLEAIALARAEDLVMFEHRDLHEGNVCIKQIKPPREMGPRSQGFFGYSGLDITILDYGLSRAEDLDTDDATPVAFDLEKDLSVFTSTHASQCKVYRQMRSFMIRADRKCLPPEAHKKPYEKGIDGPLSWDAYAPYTNVLWLAYLYEYIVKNFVGDKKELAHFKKETKEMWTYLNPDAKETVPCFGSAANVVCFAVEAGWMSEEQLIGAEESMMEREDGSIIISREEAEEVTPARRSTRKR